MSQKEISEKLSKPLSYISDIMAGIKVRQAADKAGIKTDSVSTKALAQLRSFDDKELPGKVEELVGSGGRVSDATNILKASRTTLESSKNTDESTIEPTKLSEKDFYNNDCAKKQKGFVNPISKEIQKRWCVFCRDKKIPESEKTAFKFYQELTEFFENARND